MSNEITLANLLLVGVEIIFGYAKKRINFVQDKILVASYFRFDRVNLRLRLQVESFAAIPRLVFQISREKTGGEARSKIAKHKLSCHYSYYAVNLWNFS